MKTHKWKDVKAMADKAKEKKCVECEKPCDEDSYCFGCKHYICDACDVSAGMTPMGAHRVECHLTPPEEIDDDFDPFDGV